MVTHSSSYRYAMRPFISLILLGLPLTLVAQRGGGGPPRPITIHAAHVLDGRGANLGEATIADDGNGRFGGSTGKAGYLRLLSASHRSTAEARRRGPHQSVRIGEHSRRRSSDGYAGADERGLRRGEVVRPADARPRPQSGKHSHLDAGRLHADRA